MKETPQFKTFHSPLKIPCVSGLTACPDCDLLLKDIPVPEGRKSLCPRCGSVLCSSRPNTVVRTLALTLTGLILFFPAMLLPVMTLDAMGMETATNLVHGIPVLFRSGFHAVAILIFLTGVAVPFIKLLILFVVSCAILLKVKSSLLTLFFRMYRFLDEWACLKSICWESWSPS